MTASSTILGSAGCVARCLALTSRLRRWLIPFFSYRSWADIESFPSRDRPPGRPVPKHCTLVNTRVQRLAYSGLAYSGWLCTEVGHSHCLVACWECFGTEQARELAEVEHPGFLQKTSAQRDKERAQRAQSSKKVRPACPPARQTNRPPARPPGRTDGRTDGRMVGRTDGRKHARTVARTHARTHARSHACMRRDAT